jgi:hypothetical protein
MFIVRIGMPEHDITGNPGIELKWEDGRYETLELPEPGHTLGYL